MRKMVNQSPFAHYPQLMQILGNTEKCYQELTGSSNLVAMRRYQPKDTSMDRRSITTEEGEEEPYTACDADL